jgi:nucleotidyltransferase substrate binding protein (TIGR01987 family)
MELSKAEKLLSDLRRATQRLEEALGAEPTQLHQDATIQRFEFTFELAWKLMQIVILDKGIEVFGPKNVIRRAAQVELIDDPEIWIEFLKARNLTTHVYDQPVAEEIYNQAKKFPVVVRELIERVEKEIE